MDKYKVTCKKCKSSRTVGIVTAYSGDIIDWLDNSPREKIISGRKRLDDVWGWQCLCGNNDLLSKQENEGIENKQNPNPRNIIALAKRLTAEPARFNMERM